MQRHVANPCRYRPAGKVCRGVFAWFIAHGEERRASQGLASNAYIVARDTGLLPLFGATPGTAAYAAARAGLCVRQRKGQP